MKLSEERIDAIFYELCNAPGRMHHIFARAIESEVAKMWQERMRERSAGMCDEINSDFDEMAAAIRNLPIEEPSE